MVAAMIVMMMMMMMMMIMMIFPLSIYALGNPAPSSG